MRGIWSNPRLLDRFRELIAANHTSSDIANRLEQEFRESVSRSAVCAKAKRMGLVLGPDRKPPPKMATNKRSPAPLPVKGGGDTPPRGQPVQRSRSPRNSAVIPDLGPAPEGIPWPRQCQFPHGHPGKPGFRFCGHRSAQGKPYCPDHCAVAYRQKGQAA